MKKLITNKTAEKIQRKHTKEEKDEEVKKILKKYNPTLYRLFVRVSKVLKTMR